MIEDNLITVKREKMVYSFRKLNRQIIFQNNRNFKKQPWIPSYLSQYNQQSQQLIIQSIKGNIPNSLPPLNLYTISYYRRSNLPVYLIFNNSTIDLHLLHESLWILSDLQAIKYENFLQIKSQFQNNLSFYLNIGVKEIEQMAIIVAGNKIMGKQQDIIKISERGHYWVLVNHIFDGKINYKRSFSGVLKGNTDCIECIYELSNQKDEIIKELMKQENIQIIQTVNEKLLQQNQNVVIACLKLISNILSANQDYIDNLLRLDIFSRLYNKIKSSNKLIRKYCYKCLQLIATSNQSNCNSLLNNYQLIQKLLSNLEYNEPIDNKITIMQIFVGLFQNGNYIELFKLLDSGNMLIILQNLLQLDIVQLQMSILKILDEIMLIGEQYYLDDNNENILKVRLNEMNFEAVIKSISNKNIEINELIESVLQKLE